MASQFTLNYSGCVGTHGNVMGRPNFYIRYLCCCLFRNIHDRPPKYCYYSNGLFCSSLLVEHITLSKNLYLTSSSQLYKIAPALPTDPPLPPNNHLLIHPYKTKYRSIYRFAISGTIQYYFYYHFKTENFRCALCSLVLMIM